MNILCFDEAKAAAQHASSVVEEILKVKPEAVFCLAAGHTSLPVFDAIIDKNLDFSKARFVEMDEWVGVPIDLNGSCGYFLEYNFLARTNFKKDNICLFDGLAEDLDVECGRVEEVIESWGGIDYLLLGMGLNGHLALNEPGDSFSLGARVVPLSQTTVEVAPKYFLQGMPKIDRGITLGIKNLLEAKKINIAIFGGHKSQAVEKLRESKNNISIDFPASVLHTRDNVDLLIDGLAMPD